MLLLALMDRRDVFLFVFYFPLVVGSLIVFQGKSRRVGTILAVVSFIALVLVVCMDSSFDSWSDPSSASWIIDRLLNVMGAFFILVLEIVFLIRLNENVQSLLINEYCRFSICDNGIGLKNADIERLKSGESFSTSSALTGSGLGNQLVLDFLKEHSSELEIRSEGGEGSEFAFKLKIEEN